MNEIFTDAFNQIVDLVEDIEKIQNIDYYLVGGILVNILLLSGIDDPDEYFKRLMNDYS